MIGINAQIRSTSGTAEGVGFAIPIDTARRALEQLLRTGRVAYAYIGVTTADVTPGHQFVVSVQDGSAAGGQRLDQLALAALDLVN